MDLNESWITILSPLCWHNSIEHALEQDSEIVILALNSKFFLYVSQK